ncbi:MAG: DNA-directed RNA polymerase subunit omega [Spirochaetia bacterium]
MAIEKSYIPLKKITEFHHDGNIYELTNAAIHRASQLILSGGKVVDDCKNHIVSASLTEVLSDRVHYKFEANESNEADL